MLFVQQWYIVRQMSGKHTRLMRELQLVINFYSKPFWWFFRSNCIVVKKMVLVEVEAQKLHPHHFVISRVYITTIKRPIIGEN